MHLAVSHGKTSRFLQFLVLEERHAAVPGCREFCHIQGLFVAEPPWFPAAVEILSQGP
jgi:hypothetical protein